MGVSVHQWCMLLQTPDGCFMQSSGLGFRARSPLLLMSHFDVYGKPGGVYQKQLVAASVRFKASGSCRSTLAAGLKVL